MSVPFSKTRNVELSVISAIETAINNSWSGITVVKAFLQAYDVKVPVICVRILSTDSFRSEIGDNTIRQKYSFIVDIFAKSDGQRIDLADFIVNVVKEGFVYKQYSRASGNPEELNETTDGRITFLTFDSDSRIDASDSADEHEKYRQAITFTVEKYG
jgi:hypothetical protein